MKRRLAILPFEISRWAPDVAELEELELEEEVSDTSQEASDTPAAAAETLDKRPEEGEVPWLPRADRMALAGWIRDELARLLSTAVSCSLLELEGEAEAEAEELDDLELPLYAEAASAAAVETGAELGLACRLRADGEGAELSGVLADAAGEERVRFALGVLLGEAQLLPGRAVREILIALGEDAAAAELPGEPNAADSLVQEEAVLEMVRGARALEEARRAVASSNDAGAPPQQTALSDPSPALEQILTAIQLAPSLLAARDLVLRLAARSAGEAWMPACLSALERLVELLPGDATALAALASYRRLHHDLDGARELLLRARDLADDSEAEAAVLSDLAALAGAEGRTDEAVRHLREAARLIDDPAIYLRLGHVLGAREPQESARAFQRAVVLAPEDPQARLLLARQLSILGETGRAAIEAARAAQLAKEHPELEQAAVELLRELISSAQASG